MTVAPPLDVSVIRRALQGHLSPPGISALLFEALSEFGRDVPQSLDDLRQFIHGALTDALAKHLGDHSAAQVVARIVSDLEDRPSGEILIVRGDSEPPPPLDRAQDSTAAVPTARSPVRVTVVAAGEGFARRLATALGPRRVAPRSVRSLSELAGPGGPPSVVLVDGSDFAAIEPSTLAEALHALPATTAHVVWASNLPYGRSMVDAMRKADVPSVPLGREDGIAPLLDLIRSRRSVEPSA